MATKIGRNLPAGQPMPKRVRVAADGRSGTVSMVYYDRQHTGDSEDVLVVALDDGQSVQGPAELFECLDDEAVPCGN